jgi:hypothetical protein
VHRDEQNNYNFQNLLILVGVISKKIIKTISTNHTPYKTPTPVINARKEQKKLCTMANFLQFIGSLFSIYLLNT